MGKTPISNLTVPDEMHKDLNCGWPNHLIPARYTSADLSAIGAAWLAGLAIGYWKSLDELEALPRETEGFKPEMSESDRADLIEGWRDALGRSRSNGSNR